MGSPMSNDLRERVVGAIEGGLSRRAAAAKFDVSIASAVRWHQRFRRTGSVAPDALGGDRLSYRAEAHAALVLSWIDEQSDITIAEIRGRLKNLGDTFALSTIWRLLKRHDYTVKKRRRTRVSKTATM